MFSAILNDGFLNAAIVWTLSELMHHVTTVEVSKWVWMTPPCFRSCNVFKEEFSLIPSSNIPGKLWDLNQQSSGVSPSGYR